MVFNLADVEKGVLIQGETNLNRFDACEDDSGMTVEKQPVDAVFTTADRAESFDRPCSIGHWQLRDLMHVDQGSRCSRVCTICWELPFVSERLHASICRRGDGIYMFLKGCHRVQAEAQAVQCPLRAELGRNKYGHEVSALRQYVTKIRVRWTKLRRKFV